MRRVISFSCVLVGVVLLCLASALHVAAHNCTRHCNEVTDTIVVIGEQFCMHFQAAGGGAAVKQARDLWCPIGIGGTLENEGYNIEYQTYSTCTNLCPPENPTPAEAKDVSSPFGDPTSIPKRKCVPDPTEP